MPQGSTEVGIEEDQLAQTLPKQAPGNDGGDHALCDVTDQYQDACLEADILHDIGHARIAVIAERTDIFACKGSGDNDCGQKTAA